MKRSLLSRLGSLAGAAGLMAFGALLSAAGCGSGTGTPSGPDWAACTAPGQCQLAAKGCCGTCGVVMVSDLNGVNRDQGEAYQEDNCPGPVPACAPCPGDPNPNPNLAAFCVETTCKALDIRADDVTACSTDADCHLRFSGCCESCGASAGALIALNQAGIATYVKQVCAPNQACDACAPVYPTNVKAVCEASKHCAVVPSP